jgi:hypothetical protein
MVPTGMVQIAINTPQDAANDGERFKNSNHPEQRQWSNPGTNKYIIALTQIVDEILLRPHFSK